MKVWIVKFKNRKAQVLVEAPDSAEAWRLTLQLLCDSKRDVLEVAELGGEDEVK